MEYVYLDWNIFDRIERVESLDEEQHYMFSEIEHLKEYR